MNYHCIEDYASIFKENHVGAGTAEKGDYLFNSRQKNGEATIAPGSSAGCGFIYEAITDRCKNAKFITSDSEKGFRQLSGNGQGGDKNLNELFGLTEMINKTINNLDLTLSKMSKSFQSCVCRFGKRKVNGRREQIPGF